MKLSDKFITHITDTESLLVPTGEADFSGIIRGNETLGAVLESLKEDVTRDDIVRSLKAQFNAPTDMIERDVDRALANLRNVGALDE